VNLTRDALERVKEISTNTLALAGAAGFRQRLFPGR
jgi:hypothetical protein